jgi:heterodisulfide reductase subunit A2
MGNQKMLQGNNKALVIGGVSEGSRRLWTWPKRAGMLSSLIKAPAIGGLMTQLDRTFPTNNCDLCTLSPHLAESGRQLHIELLPMTELVSLKGEAGSFTVALKTRPRFIDLDRCTACGECFTAFPECVSFTPGLDHRAPTCMRYPRATPYAYSIDGSVCRCKPPDRSVPGRAILPEDSEKTRETQVSSVVLASRRGVFDPSLVDAYGYGLSKNVLTGLEYERILSASGPTLGQLFRPSDGKQPRKIAWIQCVGSRSLKTPCLPYCSSACCMYALKEAMVTKERYRDDMEAVIFYMDMRTSGKDYELYLNRAKEEFGIRFERARPHTVEAEPGSDDLCITYLPDGGSMPRKEIFDMVVLSTGFVITPDLLELMQKLGIETQRTSLCENRRFSSRGHLETRDLCVRPCGKPQGYSETMVQASAAACMAAKTHVPDVQG